MDQIYTDTEHLYSVLMPFFKRLVDHPDIGPKVVNTGLIVQFNYTNPEGRITLRTSDLSLHQGETDIEPTVTMSMEGNTAHKFWLGNLNLLMAITKQMIIAKGPIAQILKLLPVIKNSYAMYKEYLVEIGMEDKLETG